MSNRKIKLSFICAVWNEINRAPSELEKLVKQLQTQDLLNISEIIIIDNFSQDGTREWAKSQKGEYIKVILNPKNIGKGGSIKKGIYNSKGEFGIIYDLDAEYSAIDAIMGAKIIERSKSSIVLASRTLDGRADYVYLQNYLGVRLITELINLIYNARLSDTATGLKIIDLKFYKKERIVFSGFNVDFELVCLALNKNKVIKEFNGKYFPRSKKEGKKIKAFKDGISSVLAIIRTAIKIDKQQSIPKNMINYFVNQSAFTYFRVGFISSIIDIIIFLIILNYLYLGVIFANLISFSFAFTLNIFLGIDNVFCKNSRFDSNQAFNLLLITSLFGLFINTSIIIILMNFFTSNLLIKILAIFPTFIWNYFIRRFYIFKKIT